MLNLRGILYSIESSFRQQIFGKQHVYILNSLQHLSANVLMKTLCNPITGLYKAPRVCNQ